MTVLVGSALLLVAATATLVALSRNPARQAVTLSAYGLVLTLLFVVLQAPDVALSQVAVGAAIVPLMVVLALAASGERRR